MIQSPSLEKVIRVLVVEDDPTIRQVIAYALGDEGYLVDEAPEGHAALQILDRQHPDVIILDMKMPGMDGWQFVARYRERYGHRAPIIVLTAAQDAASRGAEVNAECYLAKPFDLDELLAAVASISREATAQQQG